VVEGLTIDFFIEQQTKVRVTCPITEKWQLI
jgi:hypothetical protein